MFPNMQAFRSMVDAARDRWAPVAHTSTFRATGQITPEEFLLAGDYLVYKFPSWSWASAASRAQEVGHLPKDKQYLVTRGVPCRRRLDENFAGDAGKGETVVAAGEDGEEEWLNTGGGGGGGERRQAHERDVRALEGSQGDVEQGQDEEEEEEEIPDMDDEDDDEAIIRDNSASGANAPMRTYSLYITYSPYYSTPRMFLSGYASPGVPLPPSKMLDDIVGDYKDKTVTLEDFPFYDTSVKMASIHPCKHASVMKTLLDRADAAMKIRKMKERKSQASGQPDVDALAGDAKRLSLNKGDSDLSAKAADEWEVLEEQQDDDSEVAIRVDQYIVVFLKFMASVTPGIEHDQTMGI